MSDAFEKMSQKVLYAASKEQIKEALGGVIAFIKTYCPESSSGKIKISEEIDPDEARAAYGQLAVLYTKYPELENKVYHTYELAAQLNDEESIQALIQLNITGSNTAYGKFTQGVSYQNARNYFKQLIIQRPSPGAGSENTDTITRFDFLIESQLDACINCCIKELARTSPSDTDKIKKLEDFIETQKALGAQFLENKITKEKLAEAITNNILHIRDLFETKEISNLDTFGDKACIILAQALSFFFTVITASLVNKAFDKSAYGLISTRAEATRRFDLVDKEMAKLVPNANKSHQYKKEYQEVTQEDTDVLQTDTHTPTNKK